MNIKVKYEYLEGYFPTPRSRKERFRAVQNTITVPLKEVSMDDLHLAYRINSFTEIYAYKGKLYQMIQESSDCKMGWNLYNYKRNPLERLQDVCLYDDRMFCPTSQMDSKEKMEARVRGYLNLFLVADGVLFVESPKPTYVVETSGTPFLSNASTQVNTYYMHEHRQFPATDPEGAAQYAAEIACRHGCINLYGKGWKPRIEVFPGANEPADNPAEFDADRHKQRLQKLTKFSNRVVSAMEPICSGTCIFVKKDPENLDLYCNQCKALKTIRNLTNSLSAAETCIYDIEDAVNRSTPNSCVSSSVERWEQAQKEGADA